MVEIVNTTYLIDGSRIEDRNVFGLFSRVHIKGDVEKQITGSDMRQLLNADFAARQRGDQQSQYSVIYGGARPEGGVEAQVNVIKVSAWPGSSRMDREELTVVKQTDGTYQISLDAAGVEALPSITFREEQMTALAIWLMNYTGGAEALALEMKKIAVVEPR